MPMNAETNVQAPLRAIRIRNLVIDPPLLLAPMAGLTHSALRRIMVGFGGVGLLSTEMLSARRRMCTSRFSKPWTRIMAPCIAWGG